MNPVVAALRLLNGLSFKEKSLLISLVALLGIYGGYFADVLGGSEPSLAELTGTLIALVVALVTVHVVFHIVIALDDVEEARGRCRCACADERRRSGQCAARGAGTRRSRLLRRSALLLPARLP